ncbi:polysaccharide export protein (plasmid) [Paroceanicella profunda]|uniref:Polysaccharide export protein n=1 Tax=Paroceanicella profunda TaxID=2579971 RepID=A0A5B8G404_9RHOB|nr:polysaccharide biosynthesis/export family protein [Paroceanicella profunda]QDL94730.1 polysaccharide export protein [Paroceanicella profunda]
MRRLALFLACTALTACETVPGAGPTTQAILTDSAAVRTLPGPKQAFALVTLDEPMARKVNSAFAYNMADSAPFFMDEAPPRLTIGVSDKIEIGIVSKSDSGFIDFTQSSVAPLSTTQLPLQEVGTDGRVQVPPLGRVQAAGLTVQQFENRLISQLSQVLVEPSVVVRVADRASARAAVIGQVAQPGRFALDQEDLRLVDLVSLAGGPLKQSSDLTLSLTRNGTSYAIPFDTAITSPVYNVRVFPGDVIQVQDVRHRFVVLGGVAQNGEYEFARPELSLAAAMGQARGMNNRQADRRGVFLYRRTPVSVLADLGADVSSFTTPVVPTIYQFDFSNPTTLFAAQVFDMKDEDVIFVSDAFLEEVDKVLSLVTSIDPTPIDISP